MRITADDPKTSTRNFCRYKGPNLPTEVFHAVDVGLPIHRTGENHNRSLRPRGRVVREHAEINACWNHTDGRRVDHRTHGLTVGFRNSDHVMKAAGLSRFKPPHF